MFLNHLQELPINYIGRACLLEDLSSRWAVPVYLMNCQVNKTGVVYMGRPIYSTTYRVDGTGPVCSPIRVSMTVWAMAVGIIRSQRKIHPSAASHSYTRPDLLHLWVIEHKHVGTPAYSEHPNLHLFSSALKGCIVTATHHENEILDGELLRSLEVLMIKLWTR